VRRISSAFKDVPGGQVLGATNDYAPRLLGLDADPPSPPSTTDAAHDGDGTMPARITDLLRDAGLLPHAEVREVPRPIDLTREALRFPAARSARLQAFARGDAGAMNALAYSLLRGFGATHPTLAELRVGYLPVTVRHPYRGHPVEIGEARCTEAEAISQDAATLDLGYGLVIGRNERKAIAMAVLDLALSRQAESPSTHPHPAEDEEFVLSHIDGIDASGLVSHLKLPHYVGFQSTLDRLRDVRNKQAAT
jgi:alpha-D-ribose 1-methylphosphonate 5-triphosphate synthase subunit PhnI